MTNKKDSFWRTAILSKRIDNLDEEILSANVEGDPLERIFAITCLTLRLCDADQAQLTIDWEQVEWVYDLARSLLSNPYRFEGEDYYYTLFHLDANNAIARGSKKITEGEYHQIKALFLKEAQPIAGALRDLASETCSSLEH
jgi:hypothetical protein